MTPAPQPTPDPLRPFGQLNSSQSGSGGSGGGGGSTGGSPFPDFGKSSPNPFVEKASVDDKDFVGGGVGIVARILDKFLKRNKNSKGKMKMQRKGKGEGIENESEDEELQGEENELRKKKAAQTGKIKPFVSELEEKALPVDTAVSNASGQAIPELVSDVAPIYAFQPNTPDSNAKEITPAVSNLAETGSKIVPVQMIKASVQTGVRPIHPMTPVQIMKSVKALGPASTIQQIYPVPVGSESGLMNETNVFMEGEE